MSKEVWIEIMGMPIHAWNEGNFISVARVWGEIIKEGENLIWEDEFSSVRVKVATTSFPSIHDLLVIDIEGRKYNIFIKEIEATFESHQQQMIHTDSGQKKLNGYGTASPKKMKSQRENFEFKSNEDDNDMEKKSSSSAEVQQCGGAHDDNALMMHQDEDFEAEKDELFNNKIFEAICQKEGSESTKCIYNDRFTDDVRKRKGAKKKAIENEEECCEDSIEDSSQDKTKEEEENIRKLGSHLIADCDVGNVALQHPRIIKEKAKQVEDKVAHNVNITKVQDDSEEQVLSETEDEEEDASVEARETWRLGSELKLGCKDVEAIINYLKKDWTEPKNQENLRISTRRRGRKKKPQKQV
ncbi:hypothetical protein PIB30_047240 [Stylosanthes scabra]|uniref:DUF4283 domain-containing protein n=1 Tax=Stylosanthes scabra TaxID=79078 RepID=A0ABU6YE01_9FABA|nr:hypothetical protein [Stylosanthes scabra]